MTSWPATFLIRFPDSFPSNLMVVSDTGSSANGNVLQTMAGQGRRFVDSVNPFEMVFSVAEMRSAILPIRKLLEDLQTTEVASPPRTTFLFFKGNLVYRAKSPFQTAWHIARGHCGGWRLPIDCALSKPTRLLSGVVFVQYLIREEAGAPVSTLVWHMGTTSLWGVTGSQKM